MYLTNFPSLWLLKSLCSRHFKYLWFDWPAVRNSHEFLDRIYHSNLLGPFEVCLELPFDAFLRDAFKCDAF